MSLWFSVGRVSSLCESLDCFWNHMWIIRMSLDKLHISWSSVSLLCPVLSIQLACSQADREAVQIVFHTMFCQSDTVSWFSVSRYQKLSSTRTENREHNNASITDSYNVEAEERQWNHWKDLQRSLVVESGGGGHVCEGHPLEDLQRSPLAESGENCLVWGWSQPGVDAAAADPPQHLPLPLLLLLHSCLLRMEHRTFHIKNNKATHTRQTTNATMTAYTLLRKHTRYYTVNKKERNLWNKEHLG